MKKVWTMCAMLVLLVLTMNVNVMADPDAPEMISDIELSYRDSQFTVRVNAVEEAEYYWYELYDADDEVPYLTRISTSLVETFDMYIDHKNIIVRVKACVSYISDEGANYVAETNMLSEEIILEMDSVAVDFEVPGQGEVLYDPDLVEDHTYPIYLKGSERTTTYSIYMVSWDDDTYGEETIVVEGLQQPLDVEHYFDTLAAGSDRISLEEYNPSPVYTSYLYKVVAKNVFGEVTSVTSEKSPYIKHEFTATLWTDNITTEALLQVTLDLEIENNPVFTVPMNTSAIRYLPSFALNIIMLDAINDEEAEVRAVGMNSPLSRDGDISEGTTYLSPDYESYLNMAEAFFQYEGPSTYMNLFYQNTGGSVTPLVDSLTSIIIPPGITPIDTNGNQFPDVTQCYKGEIRLQDKLSVFRITPNEGYDVQLYIIEQDDEEPIYKSVDNISRFIIGSTYVQYGELHVGEYLLELDRDVPDVSHFLVTFVKRAEEINEDPDPVVLPKKPVTYYNLVVEATEGGTVPGYMGTHQYSSGTNVNIQAVAEEGYEFVGWSGDTDMMPNDQLIIMSRDGQLLAQFAAIIEDDNVTEAAPEVQEPATEDEEIASILDEEITEASGPDSDTIEDEQLPQTGGISFAIMMLAGTGLTGLGYAIRKK